MNKQEIPLNNKKQQSKDSNAAYRKWGGESGMVQTDVVRAQKDAYSDRNNLLFEGMWVCVFVKIS